MSDPHSALGGASFDGFATVRDVGPVGMITLRADAGLAALPEAIATAIGLALPKPRRIVRRGERAIGWMSPDEWLLVMPYSQVSGTLEKLNNALTGQYFLAVDVSDARTVFHISGPLATDVLAKLSPVDLTALAPDELRRTRIAQVACAFWKDDAGYTLVSFRSVAGYVMALLTHSAQPGSELALS